MVSATQSPAFDNSYARLPAQFFERQSPVAVAGPKLVRLNEPLARELGFDPAARSSEDWAQIFSGNALLPGTAPLAMAYAGHQFGNFVPQLGDGRALLLGEVIDRHGIRRDIQLKGAGRTPFSRGGDGRAAIGPVLREYILSEAMHALGVPATRALAAVTTGEPVYRENVLPGAVLTRVAKSHIRVGTFQYFAARGDMEAVRALADYVIERLYPELGGSENRYLDLVEAVSARQARLVARWLAIGFIHGVMNTDNMALAGETIDFGPCAFLDEYDPTKVFSSIDQFGRYAYGRQPHIAQWNIARLAETMLPLIDDDEERAIARATSVVEQFVRHYNGAFVGEMRSKIGLQDEQDDDLSLIQRLLELMQESKADYNTTFRALCSAASPDGAAGLHAQLGEGDGIAGWLEQWRRRLEAEGVSAALASERMEAINPLYIPRNHLVEEVIAAAEQRDDFGPFEALLERVTRPFEPQPDSGHYADPARPDERVMRTFCGT
ncbi:MAG: YdiU family protein [Rhodobiaceae bacterium]|nr:YdiU family protein [Rhodobiaceae bacterium]MCC0056581.1 YdiU family protein [Rhodobiaceae bacterium]